MKSCERLGLSKWVLAAAVAAAGMLGLGAGGGIPEAQARRAQPDEQASVALLRLPTEAQDTYHRVLQGGPFAHSKDGMVFGNRERQLPARARGYYREYTVETPGASDRGARRIVCGGPKPQAPDRCYYTADHYASFARIVP